MFALDRDDLGRLVRAAWIDWAMKQPAPKASWLVPYDELSEADKEADRQIGEAVALVVASAINQATADTLKQTLKVWTSGAMDRAGSQN